MNAVITASIAETVHRSTQRTNYKEDRYVAYVPQGCGSQTVLSILALKSQ